MTRLMTAFSAILLAAGLLAGAATGPASAQFADAQEDATVADATSGEEGAAATLSADDLRALVAPVALYPDELLAIVLPAATNPLQVVEAQRFLEKQKSDGSLQPDADWDPAVLALLNYPEVVKQMNDDLDWTQALGNAVMDQQKDVLDAVQAARAAASDAGYLQSNEQQTVVNDNDNIVIESTEPNVVYVPTYDPAPIVNNTYVEYPPPVYSDPYPSYYAPGATFLAGAFVGAAFAYGFDWDNDDIDIDNDINIDRGDVNIGSGNTNIDRTEIQNKFNGDRKAGAEGKMKWSPEKARQKSSAPRKTQAGKKPTSANIAKQLGSGGGTNAARPANSNAQRNLKTNKSAQQQSRRGNESLAKTKQPKQQLQRNASQKQQMQRQQQRPQKQQMQQRQVKQQKGGSFQNMPPRNTAKAQSNRGNRSMSGGSQPRPKRR